MLYTGITRIISNAGATPTGAIREGEWKLIEFFEDGKLSLYKSYAGSW